MRSHLDSRTHSPGEYVLEHCRSPGRTGRLLLGVAGWLCALAVMPAVPENAFAQEIILGPGQQLAAPAPVTTDLKLELYIRPDSEQCKKAQSFLADLQRRRPGIRVDVYDVSQDAAALARVKALSAQFGRSAALPTVYGANQLVVGFRDAATTGNQIENLFTMEVFIRKGCPRCAAATPYLAGLRQRYPGLNVVFYEVTNDPGAQARLAQLNQTYGVPSGIPTVHFGGRLNVGWSGIEITGSQIEGLLQSASAPPRVQQAAPAAAPVVVPGTSAVPASRAGQAWFALLAVAMVQPPTPDQALVPAPGPQEARSSEPGQAVPLALDGLPAEAELPEEADGGEATEVLRPTHVAPPESIKLPFFGRLDPRSVGMPAFTLALGLIDGFNPCAMWVLIFLLSVLVTLNDRRKMVAIAGTFVVVSGLAYFLFMAAWLNAFHWISVLDPSLVPKIQAVLGVIAVVVGVIHVKDFFAFKKGITLSIPESAKPTIYGRVRQIVSAKSLVPALTGAVILAVLVNLVELLCTAGIPAIYTHILSARNYPSWVNYSYIGLYILAYMFDDSVLLIAVVATLSRRRLQEKEGRWLKLVSGAVILGLGIVMLIKPEWLH